MASAQYRDEVLITLSSLDAPPTFSFPDRRFLLTKESPTMKIGRTSKRNSTLEAAKGNAWFDSAVMSRDHAQLRLDVDNQKVYIKDIGSLHGTFQNEQRLAKNIPALLATGDLIRFGISIDRGSDRYPPCVMEARMRFGPDSPENRPKVFRVPDDTDVEDLTSDDDQSIHNSSSILHKLNVQPTLISSPSSSRSPIDLTMNDQYPISSVRDDYDHAASALPPVPSNPKPIAKGELVDLTSSVQGQSNESSRSSPAPLEAASTRMASTEVHRYESTDMDTENSSGDEPSSPSPSPSPRLCLSPRPTWLNCDDISAGSDSEPSVDFDEEDDFEERDEFQDDIEEVATSAHLPAEVKAPVPWRSFRREEPQMPMPFKPYSQGTNALLNGRAYGHAVNAPSDLGRFPILNSCDECQTDAIDNYAMLAKLPPIDYRGDKPPSLTPNTPSLQPSMKLPSIFCELQSSQNRAAMMRSKEQYFAAREVNKKMVGTYQPLKDPTMEATRDEQMAKQAQIDEAQMAKAKDAGPGGRYLRMRPHIYDPEYPTQSEFRPALTLTSSELTESADQFLLSPPVEVRDPPGYEAFGLNEGSAYQFEMSKKAAGASTVHTPTLKSQGTESHEPQTFERETTERRATEVRAAEPRAAEPRAAEPRAAEPRAAEPQTVEPRTTKPLTAEVQTSKPPVVETSSTDDGAQGLNRTQVGINDIIGPPIELSSEPEQARRSLKRKAVDISEMTPIEVRAAAIDKTLAALRNKNGPHKKTIRGDEVPRQSRRSETSESADSRPSKRLRRVAEVFGYAALGGVAVMSALIATAPTL
ncbi:hypothetical protein G7046_g7357 [Stylonectria norvegica]|nr:hypothetical protein G7046_g7357 [Stylonectria norvegica]